MVDDLHRQLAEALRECRAKACLCGYATRTEDKALSAFIHAVAAEARAAEQATEKLMPYSGSMEDKT